MTVDSRPPQAGFTLIEMIVVIIIMALISSLVLVRQPWRSTGLNMDATIQALADGLKLARSRAIAQGRNVRVVTVSRGFSVDSGPVWLLPPEQTLNTSQVVFMPDGGSTGASILLVSGSRRVAVSVNWLTGRVRSQQIEDK